MHFENPPPLVAILREAETMMTFIRCAVLTLMLTPAPVVGEDLDKGLDAYNSGDNDTALRELKPLAEQGNARAQAYLGVMYFTGRSVPENETEAAKWYRLAAEQGDALGQLLLGHSYLNSIGVAEDHNEAVKWLRKAAEQGFAVGQLAMGEVYYEGQGVAQDYVSALMWFTIATANGESKAAETRESTENMQHYKVDVPVEEAAKARERTKNMLQPDAVLEAERRAKICMESNYQKCEFLAEFDDSAIVSMCNAEWGDNFEMVAYCRKQQRAAGKAWVSILNTVEPGSPTESIVQGCIAEWEDNYEMLVYCHDQQKTAFESLADTPDSIPNEIYEKIVKMCNIEWSNNFEMVLYCREQQIKSWKSLQ